MSAGRVWTRAFNEKPYCCRLGCTGGLICLAALPLSTYSPVGGLGLFCCLSTFLRLKVVRDFDVEDEKCFTCCCGSCNRCMDLSLFGMTYPCSFFQMIVSLDEWEQEKVLQTQQVEVSAPPPAAIATALTPVEIQ